MGADTMAQPSLFVSKCAMRDRLAVVTIIITTAASILFGEFEVGGPRLVGR
ncbi:hypothetical protein BDD14_0468 [Edaphobacter modestus]|uniref:Uncharacterized protein n=1 Tax=Edaphobacter modestus TaxID=388466 RepID=A0A4Q7YQF5_9BACT|nr:hypothetical protein BDD14_0468 [Edaphobacter modestus]